MPRFEGSPVLPAILALAVLSASAAAEPMFGDNADIPVPMGSQARSGKVERLLGLVREAQAAARSGRLDAEGLQKTVDRAKVEAKKALDRSPRDAYVLNSVARLHLQVGLGGARASEADYREGLAYAEQAVAEADRSGDRPALVLALRTRGVGRHYGGDYPGAESDRKRIQAISPRDPVAGALERLIAGRTGPAGTVAGGGAGGGAGGTAGSGAGAGAAPAAGTSAPDAGEADWAPRGPGGKPMSAEGARAFVARMARTEALLLRKEYAAAREEATQSLLEFGDNPRAYRQRAEALRGLKMHREAAADATRGLGLRPGAWQLLAQRAMANNEAGRFADALADAEATLATKPESAEAWLVRAAARRSLGEPPEAYREDFRRAAGIEPAYRELYAEALSEADGKAPAAGGPRPAAGGEPRAAAGSSLAQILQRPPPRWLVLSLGIILLVLILAVSRSFLRGGR